MRNLRKKLSKVCELPEGSFGCNSYLAIESNTTIRIDGCEEILSYDEKEVSLRLRDVTVTVTGEGMTLRSYAMKTVRIVGVIENVALAETRHEKKG